MKRGAARVGMAVTAIMPLLLSACTAPASSARQEEPPGPPVRIVSMNPCVDAILEEIADPASIAAISHYSQDPRSTSVRLDWARRFPAVSDAAEDVIAARPDLVISGAFVAPQTLAALERLGIPLLKVDVPSTVPESQAQIMQIAGRIGRSDEGRALNARIDEAVARARAHVPASGRRPEALIWQDSGLVPGEGTLADALLRQTGFVSASRRMGLAQWDMVTLERIVSSPPDIVMTGASGMAAGAGGTGARMLSHPILARLKGRMMTADFPASLLHCGGPNIIRTVEKLGEIRERWEQEQGA